MGNLDPHLGLRSRHIDQHTDFWTRRSAPLCWNVEKFSSLQKYERIFSRFSFRTGNQCVSRRPDYLRSFTLSA